MKSITWTKEKIHKAFERYIREHGRLPTALEVDTTDYLPSSRHIQREFGGLKMFRASLGYPDSNFAAGTYRSKIAHRVNHRGRTSELELEDQLRDRFGEVFVHTEKVFSDRKTRVDFYVYTPEGNFGIDIFYPDNMRTLQSNLNIKMKKYDDFSDTLFYVIANNEIDQTILDKFLTTKKIPLPKNHKLVNIATLSSTVLNMRTYPNPLTT